MKQATISIITITFNNLCGLKSTVESVQALDYESIEHIIIDGKSTDGSVDYLTGIHNKNFKWISEPDKGIYHAMNKGLKLVVNNWVIFMNAGDLFHDKNTLSNIKFPENPAVMYGNTQVLYETGFSRLMTIKPLSYFWKALPFSHQSVIVHQALLKNGFDTAYTYCADFAVLYGLYQANTPFINTKITLANVSAGGVSDHKRYLATKEVYQISQKTSPSFKKHFYFIPKIIASFVVVKLKTILPKGWQNTLYKLKYR